MKERTTRKEYYQTLKNIAAGSNMPPQKLSSFIMNGAAVTVGCGNGLIAVCEKNESLPEIIFCHCIIHQEALWAIKVYNYIRDATLLHKPFKVPLEDVEAGYEDLTLRTS